MANEDLKRMMGIDNAESKINGQREMEQLRFAAEDL